MRSRWRRSSWPASCCTCRSGCSSGSGLPCSSRSASPAWSSSRRALQIGSDGSRLLAGAVFALWPTFTILIGSTSAAALPGLVVPWARAPAGLGRPGPFHCDAGGSQVRRRDRRNGRRQCGLHSRRADAASPVHPDSRQVAAADRAEPEVGRRACSPAPPGGRSRCCYRAGTPSTSCLTSSSRRRPRGPCRRQPCCAGPAPGRLTSTSAAPRGFTAGWAMVSSPPAILASAVASAVGLAGLARRDMPERRWLCICVGLAAMLALAGYYGPLGGPWHADVDSLLDGPLAPFRSHLQARAGHRRRARAWAARTRWTAAGGCASGSAVHGARRSAATAPVVALVLAGLALPQLTGQVLQAGSFTSVPGYWYQAAAYLAAHSPAADRPGRPGEPARSVHLGRHDRRPAGAARHLAVGRARPGALRRGGLADPAGDRRAGDRVRRAGPRPARLPSPSRNPLRRRPQRHQSARRRLYTRRRSSTRPWLSPGFRRVASFGPQVSRCGRLPEPRRRRHQDSRPAIPPSRYSRQTARHLQAGQPGRGPAGQPDRAGQRRARLAAAARRTRHSDQPADRHRRPASCRQTRAVGDHRRAAPGRQRLRLDQQLPVLHLYRERDKPGR